MLRNRVVVRTHRTDGTLKIVFELRFRQIQSQGKKLYQTGGTFGQSLIGILPVLLKTSRFQGPEIFFKKQILLHLQKALLKVYSQGLLKNSP